MSEYACNDYAEEKPGYDCTTSKMILPPHLQCKSSFLDKNEVINQKDNISDDLTSLEREIAEMHHMQLISPVVVQRVEGQDGNCAVDEDSESKKVLLEIQPALRDPKNENTFEICQEEDNIEILRQASTIKNEDLIALLKGTDQTNDGDHTITSCEISEDVTIEGEGQFPIIEVIDDDIEDIEIKDPTVDDKIIDRKILTTINNPKQLTPEEERAVAMEQIAGLKSRGEKRRRKQDIVPLQIENVDLATSLGAEWSDDEPAVQQVANKTLTKKILTLDSSQTDSAKQPNSSVISSIKIRSNTSKVQNLIVKKSMSNKSDTNGNDKTKQENDEEIDEKFLGEITGASPTTGFKRTRIIKRKIIWDPDAPETQISFANLVRSKKSDSTNIKKETVLNKSSSLMPKVETVEKKRQRLSTTLTSVNVNKSTKLTIEESSTESSSPKRRSQTPVTNGAAGGKKKKISEIDRLMGDEGAINMLNALEVERHRMGAEENDKPHKPLMRSRAANQSEKVNKGEATSTTPKKEMGSPPAKVKRISKSKASASWDYVYQQQTNDESMIIRRRSNSSYSSSASQPPLSLDGPITQKSNVKHLSTSIPDSKTKNLTESRNLLEDSSEFIGSAMSLNNLNNSKQKLISEKTFEFAKPQSKLNQKQNSKCTKSPLGAINQQSTNENKGKIALEPKHEVTKPTKTTDVFLKKSAKTAQIIFNTQKAKQEYTFTIQMMNKLSEILKTLDQDAECNVVVLLTTSINFCQGIDLTDLITSSEEKRKSIARQLAKATKNYLKTLATFSKPLIAGVNGHVVGLGVTQLPLFDYVIASDKGTYETKYAKIGQLPEGFCFWNISGKVRANIRTKLFWLCEKVHSTDGILSGFISKLVPQNKVNEEALAVARKIGAMPQQTFQETKKIINEQSNDILNALNSEFDVIVDQWSSIECYENLKKLMEVTP